MPLIEMSHPIGINQVKTIQKHTTNGQTLDRGQPNGLTNGDAPFTIFEQNGTDEKNEDAFALLCFRNLLFDICNQNGGGHGGSAIGMAAIGVALFKYVMNYNPSNPDWIARDRFVLSNGHAAMFLYALNYLVGYDNWTIDELKGYGSAKLNGYTTLCHAHPEREIPGVEVTTGPLGQGVANAVGLAIAAKNLAAQFNKPNFDLVQSRIYCITGDGCLMEGVALEAIALAGHLQLDNLVLIYDNNQVTCDGPLDWINTEDVNAKMRACGWAVLDIADGSYDVMALVTVLRHAQNIQGKPVFINVHTVIGLGTSVAGTAKAHHGAFDKSNVAESKLAAHTDPSTTHQVPERALSYFRERKSHGERLNERWERLMQKYATTFPEQSANFQERVRGGVSQAAMDALDAFDTSSMKKLATRESNGVIMEKMWPLCKALCGGGADLVNSNKVYYSETDVFLPGHYSGRYVRYGIREHAMASISNGISAFNPGTYIPITATFLMFYLYAAPGVRMGALSHLQTLHFATHDSFAEGQNGPTHQPVEVDSLYRAMPNLTYFRPCDAEETIAAWKYGLLSTTRPTMVSLGRDPVGDVPGTNRKLALRGAYVIQEDSAAAVTLVSCGTNLHRVVAAAKLLAQQNIACRLVSCPSMDIFGQQDEAYRASVFPLDGRPIVSVEEYVATTWARYVTASISMVGWGYSASSDSNYQRFGLDAESISRKVDGYLSGLNGNNARTAGWKQL